MAWPQFLSAAPSVEFVGAADNFGVKQIRANGTPLLVDDAAGFYLIGSGSGVDDRNNIASFVSDNKGVMRSMNGEPKVSLPYTFVVRTDSKVPNKLSFQVTLGPATLPLATVSMPIDGRRYLFTRYRYEGAATAGEYEQNSDHYAPPGREPYNLKFAPGNPKWGEMIGPEYTVRVTIAGSSRPLSLAFVDAPSLSTGVRNVEFGFGGLAVGERASASGFVEVVKTDPQFLR
jgi:hypothetical protein